MEKSYCPKCKGNLKPVYRNAYKGKDGRYYTLDGAVTKPKEWLCEPCERIFFIEIVGIL